MRFKSLKKSVAYFKKRSPWPTFAQRGPVPPQSAPARAGRPRPRRGRLKSRPYDPHSADGTPTLRATGDAVRPNRTRADGARRIVVAVSVTNPPRSFCYACAMTS